jgi:hypothetical protein
MLTALFQPKLRIHSRLFLVLVSHKTVHLTIVLVGMLFQVKNSHDFENNTQIIFETRMNCAGNNSIKDGVVKFF